MPAVVAPAVGLRYTGTMAAAASVRDIRLDLFRGLALWFIFLDHIPTNIVSWLTVRNYGFSDATEIFVYISGYTAVIAYSRMMEREGWIRAAARIYRRVWQLYVAHILLFVAFASFIFVYKRSVPLASIHEITWPPRSSAVTESPCGPCSRTAGAPSIVKVSNVIPPVYRVLVTIK